MLSFARIRINLGISTMTSTVSDRDPIGSRTSRRRGLNYIAGLIGVGLTYFVLAKIGLALALIHPSASAIWPPTGFALAAIVLWGYRVWPAIFLAAMIANATAAGSIGTAVSIATGNTLEALVGAVLINVWSNGRDTFSTSNAVAKFAVICGALATPISATVGATTLVMAGHAEWAKFSTIWLTWWLGDMISALVVTPVVVLLFVPCEARAFRRTEFAESAAVIAVAVAVGSVAFTPLFKESQQPGALGFLAILPLLWAALRCGPRDTAVASLVLAGFSIWGTFSGAGLFAAASLNDSLLLILVFLISASIPSLALSADVAMRKTIEENLRRTHTELDRRVGMRTAELADANLALRDEVLRRADTEREALEQYTATSGVLRVIASSPGELQPVFQAIVENAVRLCDAKVGILFLHENGMFTATATLGLLPAFDEFLSKRGPFRPGPNTTNGHLLQNKQVSHWDAGVVDSTLVKVSGARTTLGVPMLKDDALIGSIVIFRQEVRPFTDKQIALLQNFAAQAVIAIENTRLLGELRAANQALRDEMSRRAASEREALEQHTATSEALRVISSSPGELQPAFQAMLESAVRLCEARAGVMFRHENGLFNATATIGVAPEFSEFLSRRGPFRPDANSTNGRLLRTRQVTHWDAGDVTCTTVDVSGARTTLGVPMLKDDLLIGSIVIFRQEVRPFADKQIALVQNFAAQAVIAIENTRLLSELRARTSELTRSVDELRALDDVSQAVNSTLDLRTVLVTIIATAMQISGTEAGAIYVFNQTKGEFELSATFGMSQEMIAAMRDMHAELSAAVGSRAATHEASQIPDLREVPATPLNDVVLRSGYRALLLVPLLRSGRVVGALVVRRRAPGEFAPSTIDLLKTFAAQSVLAIQNARLFAEIENKSRQLELANTAKSRFLAMASHDLRQPLHALGLFVAQLRTRLKSAERAKTVERVDAAVGEMTEMFNSLLDISRLDAGVLTPRIAEFPVARLLQKIETAFDPVAREKGLDLRVVPSDAWVRSDALLLERILLNLVSNAVRYASRGGIVVGCRRRGQALRIEIWDSGPGIPEDQKQNIFGEFVQLSAPQRDRHGGLGLGLAIVDRLRRLLDHEIELTSTVGRGSRFTVLVPIAAEGLRSVETVRLPHPAAFAVEGKVVLVIDDAPIVLEGTRGLLGKWGYSVITAASDEAALAELTGRALRPDLIISDYHLANGTTGIEAIERIERALGASIPAVLISGDTAPERLRDAKEQGYILLHKPVDPMRLRAVMHELFRDRDDRKDTARALQ
jgi:signal transduction histidine kinase/integral membrane sensor domain MASE1/CheY-like chemotaxis protein